MLIPSGISCPKHFQVDITPQLSDTHTVHPMGQVWPNKDSNPAHQINLESINKNGLVDHN